MQEGCQPIKKFLLLGHKRKRTDPGSKWTPHFIQKSIDSTQMLILLQVKIGGRSIFLSLHSELVLHQSVLQKLNSFSHILLQKGSSFCYGDSILPSLGHFEYSNVIRLEQVVHQCEAASRRGHQNLPKKSLLQQEHLCAVLPPHQAVHLVDIRGD